MADPLTLPTWGDSDGTFPDGSDAYANNAGAVISFQHLPSSAIVYFKAFITAFNETFTSDWSQESVYGRSDPIYMFKQTKRNVNLAFKIPAASEEEAQKNIASVQQLAQFLYPSYADVGSATTITQSPLIRLKVINLLKNSTTELGLLGAIDSIAIDHGLSAVDGVIEVAQGTILSKLIEVNLNFSAIHEHELGWGAEGFTVPTFPYNAGAPPAGNIDDVPVDVGDGETPEGVVDTADAAVTDVATGTGG